MDMTDLREKLRALPSGANVVLILTSGTTMRGGNDNLRLAGAALLGAGFTADRFHVHVDAALMGPYLLFATSVPSEIRPSFFNHPFINSICFSGHKALGTTGCCGVLVWNKKFMNKEAFDAVEYTKADSRTGSRSGADVLELYARVFGFSEVCRRNTIDQCLDKAKRLNACSITVWFPRPPNGFGFSLVYEGGDAHVITMPQVTQELLDEFTDKYLAWWNSSQSGN
jgi:glutamate/tyrosine decarboxylase-like PLP-dependent enzyme